MLSIALPIKMLPMHEEWSLHKMPMCEERFTLCRLLAFFIYNPVRCENSSSLTADDMPTAQRPIHLHPHSIPSPSVSSVRDDCIPDLPTSNVHREPTSGRSRNDQSSAELDHLSRCMSHRRKILKRIPSALAHIHS